MKRRDFLHLAHTYESDKYRIAGWFVSEKLDGMRAFWDGGISRGLPAEQVPYANVAKDYRLKDEVIATGLWSRYGKVIRAPDWLLDQLPVRIFRDGELWLGRGRFQELVSIVKQFNPDDPRWYEVRHMIFDSPSPEQVFSDGEIKNLHFHKVINKSIRDWVFTKVPRTFTKIDFMTFYYGSTSYNDTIQRVKQIQLPHNEAAAKEKVEELFEQLTQGGAEGIILRHPDSLWIPKRSHQCLKMKPAHDAEAIITGYKTGEKTDKGSKFLGMIGAIVANTIQDNDLQIIGGQEFKIGGLTDEERRFSSQEAIDWAEAHPGETVPDWIHAEHFNRGQVITFKFRELTKEYVPKEGRYFR